MPVGGRSTPRYPATPTSSTTAMEETLLDAAVVGMSVDVADAVVAVVVVDVVVVDLVEVVGVVAVAVAKNNHPVG